MQNWKEVEAKNQKNILNCLTSELIEDIEFKVSTKIEIIISELIVGKNTSLDKILDLACDHIETDTIENILLNNELNLLKEFQLVALWLDTEDGSSYYKENMFTQLIYDKSDVSNYIYNHIDFYKFSEHSASYLLELLYRQCWLKATLKECELFYKKLYDEVIKNIQYDDFNVLIPDFVESLEDIQFYYINGGGIDSLTFKEYEKHLLVKLITLIEKETIDESFFSGLTGSYVGFDLYWDNSEFYSLLPPIYFAKKIMETEEFRYPLDFRIDKEIKLDSLDSKLIMKISEKEEIDHGAFSDKVLTTTIEDIKNYASEEYNQIGYENTDHYIDSLSNHSEYDQKEVAKVPVDTLLKNDEVHKSIVLNPDTTHILDRKTRLVEDPVFERLSNKKNFTKHWWYWAAIAFVGSIFIIFFKDNVMDILMAILMIVTLVSSLFLLPLNTRKFNKRIHNIFNKLSILVNLFIIGFIFSIALAAVEYGQIGRGISSPLPWEVWELMAGDNYINRMLGQLDNAIYLLWIFILPAHISSWLEYKKKGQRPYYHYMINILIGILMTWYQLTHPMYLLLN